MSTPVVNFGKVTVGIGYGATETSITLSTGHGSRLPSTFPFPLTWWNATDYSDPSDDPNREIVTAASGSGDTFTIERGAESTVASTKNDSGKTYKMLAGITAEMWDSLQTRRTATQSFRGLNLRTHPDSDLAASKLVFSADSIVMDDGEEVQTWDDITIDITASGVNGIDTGTEAASRNYDVYALYNGTTKAGCLHRSKDYFLDEDFSTTDDGAVALRDASARTRLSQGFQVDVAGPLEYVDVKLIKTGTPTGNFYFTLEANSGGVPSNTPLATSQKFDITRLGTTSRWLRVPFRTPYSVSAATQYHLVLRGDFTISGANYMSWRADTSSSGYAKGSKAAYDGATWTSDANVDFMFKIYITQNDSAVTLPTGYTQKALIGFCRNNGLGDLIHMEAQDRTVMLGYSSPTAATPNSNYIGTYTAQTVQDLSYVLPPRPVIASFGVDSGSGSNYIWIADGSVLSPTVTDPTGMIRGGQTGAGAYAGDRPGAQIRGVRIESQSASIDSGSVYLWLEEFTW